MDTTKAKSPKFVILRGIKHGNTCFCLNSETDPRYSATGELWYDIIGYADTVEEAQIKIYGRAFPLSDKPNIKAEVTTSSALSDWPTHKLITLIEAKTKENKALYEELAKINKALGKVGIIIGLQDPYKTHEGVESIVTSFTYLDNL